MRTQPLDLAIVRQIADLQPGWHSAPSASWSVAGESYEARSAVKRCLAELYTAGEIERIFVLHADRQLLIYNIDPRRLWQLLEELES